MQERAEREKEQNEGQEGKEKGGTIRAIHGPAAQPHSDDAYSILKRSNVASSAVNSKASTAVKRRLTSRPKRRRGRMSRIDCRLASRFKRASSDKCETSSSSSNSNRS